jgi:hypothetical protein
MQQLAEKVVARTEVQFSLTLEELEILRLDLGVEVAEVHQLQFQVYLQLRQGEVHHPTGTFL